MRQEFTSIILIFAFTLAVAAVEVPLSITEPSGMTAQQTPVRSGVPFPIGALKTTDTLQLVDAKGIIVPLQSRVSATWRDGSVKWVLLDFQVDLTPGERNTFTLRTTNHNHATNAMSVENAPDALWINTGRLRFSILKQKFGIFGERLQQSLTLGKEFSNIVTRVLPPEQVVVEEDGPLRTVVKIVGWMDDGATNKLVQYIVRVHAFAGSSDVLIEHTVIQMNPRIKMLWVENLSLTLAAQPARAPMALTQLKEGGYTIVRGTNIHSGLRAPGWFNIGDAGKGLMLAMPDFWQQFPKALTVVSNAVRVGLYPAEADEPFDMDQGLAKTHTVLVSFGEKPFTDEECEAKLARLDQPLFAQASIQWYCDSKVFGEIAPFDFDLFPDYETLTEASGDKFIKSMATGLRNWGDVYYGGPYKGKNSYMNLEYDVPHNFLVQFARTGLRKYLDAARRMAQHQADIDINHFTKWQWKHSPRHTEIQAEFGHTFTRGLIENAMLTGNQRTLEGAVTLGDYFIKQIRNPRDMGNERQIGWGLISLLPVYEATWDKKYLEAAREAVDRLVAGQDERGKFNIRWDNRIAFFNGIAATGFIYYERATGDAKAAEAGLRTIRRTKGMYPEYAGRTLEALAWAYQQTNDPEYLDLLKLTYETTMARQIEWNTMELGAPTIFSVHTLPFLEQAGLVSRPAQPLNLTAEQFASDNGLHAHHVPAGSGDVYLDVSAADAFDLVIVRKGAWKADATAELFDPAGSRVQKWTLPREGKVWQREFLRIKPTRLGAWRLALRSATIPNARGGSYVTWDVATSRALPAVLQTPGFSGLQFVTPYLFTVPKGDTDKIELELTGEGEGFKKAVVYDPDGNVAGTMEAFVDLGDTGRYTYKLSATIPPQHMNGIWKMSLQDVSLAKLSGLVPYFATSKESFFKPDAARP